ncbi:MAG: oligopeptide transporter, OPT family [Luteococcus sp.]|uniref:OPT family oligopeptide transporter n=1 Tax=Luteococcus sp. TaxID=1969402 RepID=UPI0026495415|nr:oligopeptide transporter, OPT family [Luteococcus sp.]MDN5564755.1 oligopeptide transporter, OPT family [Luteococcus sp.]
MSSTHVNTAGTSGRAGLKELTLRGVIIGGIITLVFTAANVYLGLKVGLTFATSIPAAVISMAVLRMFHDHTIVENNIVQTIASAAGTLSAIIFVLPGLVMLGYWQGFPYWTTAAVCFFGGLLGVMYSIPLRRALVTGSDLPYPEGVAAAEVLRVGDSAEGGEENARGLKVITVAGLSAALFTIVAKMKLVAEGVEKAFRVGTGGTLVGSSLSLALIGVGHLVGITVGIAMIVGLLISYGFILPFMSRGHLDAAEPFADGVKAIFSTDVRLIGAGTMAVAAVWTLVKIIGPIIKGISESLASHKIASADLAVEERDLSMKVVIGTTLASMFPIGALLWLFTRGTPLEGNSTGLVITSVIFVLLVGLFVASVCGYMAGLIGASNSPISGVGIIVAIAAALLIKGVHGAGTGEMTEALVAYTLFTTAVVFGVATISNDNLQDLKTGQLVGATPWKQQVALIIGVAFGSAIIPPVLGVMNTSFGFAGAPGAGSGALAAPQASLISTLAKGVLGGGLDWNLLGIGALIGCVVIAINETLGKTTKGRMALPPLAVGMGMYLPISLTLMIPIGALLGLFYDKWADRTANPERSKRMGTLLATGLIVGESLFGVVYAGIVASTGEEEPMSVVTSKAWANPAQLLGIVVFAALVGGLYTWTRKKAVEKA